MLSDKEIKKEFKVKASKNPKKYYATQVLESEGFKRKKCKCGTYYWTFNDSPTCGDAMCSGGFSFIGKSPAKHELDYIGFWEKFTKLFRQWGYTPISRYPVAARWRADTDFVQASIFNFQPYVVNGEIKPPANPLVVPQFCMRFNDVDNVGITGSHNTGFIMVGQHTFVPPKEWDQDKYFLDIHNWLRKGLGLPKKEIIYHEDSWAGGGNFGASMEFFSRGLEIGNQVYMSYEQVPKGPPKELKLKVLDMGMSYERNPWLSQGETNSYETTFPSVCKLLYNKTGIKKDKNFLTKFAPLGSLLNLDEIDDPEKVWKDIAKKIDYEVKDLKNKVYTYRDIYSIGDHTRSLLIAINDGLLPSNTGAGYNLRYILRRAFTFCDQNKWKLDFGEIVEKHAKFLKPLYPELVEDLDDVTKILNVEKRKYNSTKLKTKNVVERIINKKIDKNLLIDLYDSQGIGPELIQEEAKKIGKDIKIPNNFSNLIAEKHLKKKVNKEKIEIGLNLKDIPETNKLFYGDWKFNEFEAKVLKTIRNEVILDRTAFYATSGGQDHDIGTLNGQKVLKVKKQDNYIVHILKDKPKFKKGDKIKGIIDIDRRKQITQHHTAVHIINGAARKVLGNHVWQAGSDVNTQRGRLDITHYETLTDKELKEIEDIANDIVKKDFTVVKKFMSRDEAEGNYGFRLYQGGAVPGKEIRVVNIEGFDVEACGGTHLNSTGEADKIKIVKSTKISDSVVRIDFVAGDKQEKDSDKRELLIKELERLFGCSEKEIVSRGQELFDKWKKVRKYSKKKKEIDFSLQLESKEKKNLNKNEIIKEIMSIFRVQEEHILNTAKRFLDELEKKK